MSNRVRTRESKTGETVAYSEAAIRHNASAVEYCRTSMAALSGSTAGKLAIIHFKIDSIAFDWISRTIEKCEMSLNFNIYFRHLGIMGLTGIIGFLFYLVSVVGLWCLLLMKTGSNWKKFFINRQSLLTNGFLGGLCTYVLFWTFLYGMVHVY